MHYGRMDTDWFKSRKKELGVNDTALGEALGVDRSVANRVVNGAVEFNARRADEVAALLKVTPEEILFRAGIRPAPATVSNQLPTRSVDGGETAQLMRLDLSLPMGPGATVDDYVEEEPVEFDLGYLRAITRTPVHRLRLARGVGDSMMPTLLSSDEVLIDTTQNQLLHSDRIYAASINGGAAIKRLRPIEGGKRILIISDNKTIEPYPVDANEVMIWGRVIRFARDL
jgi:phage repressor protein C with HTH and peptisase S24 domain